MQSVLTIIYHLANSQFEEDKNLIEFIKELPNHIIIEPDLPRILEDHNIGIKDILAFFELLEEIAFQEIKNRVLPMYKEHLN
mmetsp:Transcript_28975/g.26331  ORF Transcript_28975/g.26331 Transcript_28975/m.26331 type:complete len:82 (+) Transcript_28975:3899-4144(+)